MDRDPGNYSLTIQASDPLGGEASTTVPIKLCVCNNSGVCLYDVFVSGP